MKSSSNYPIELTQWTQVPEQFIQAHKEIYAKEKAVSQEFSLTNQETIGLKLLIYRFLTAKVVNSVYPIYTQAPIDLKRIEQACVKNSLSYARHKKFTGLPVKIKEGDLHFTAVFFKSGRINCVGLQQDDPLYFQRVLDALTKYQYDFFETPLISSSRRVVANRVYSIRIPKLIDLDHLEYFNRISTWKQIKYNNQSFPGVICDLQSSKAKILFFKTGSMITTGVTSVDCRKRVILEFLSILGQYLSIRRSLQSS